jgi:hypothetical protein
MKFEELANELLLDLFELLDAVPLLRAFHNLNSRFNTLLFTHFRAYHLDFRSLSKHNFDIICQQHIPLIIDRVISLDISNEAETPNLLQLFLSYNFTFDQFSHLQKLSLYHMHSFDTLNPILIQFRHLRFFTHLNLLKCNIDQAPLDIHHIINNIWSLSKLTHCNLDRIFPNQILSTDIQIVSQSIKSLVLKDMYCRLSILFHLFKFTPHLQRLHVIDIASCENEQLQPVVSSLISLNISFTGSICSMEILFQNLPNLYHLTIHTSSIYINGHEWKKIIVNHLPKIKIFRLRMDFSFSAQRQQTQEEQIDDLLHSFSTSFWIEEHRWFVRYDYHPTKTFNPAILYTLPYAFRAFTYAGKRSSKSTCPNEKDFWSYDQVQTLEYSNRNEYLCTELSTNSFCFPNLRHLKIDLPLDGYFLTAVPSLYHLTSLHITSIEDSACFHLQSILDRAPRLYSLTVEFWPSIQSPLYQVKNTSIRRLVFTVKRFTIFHQCDQCLSDVECALLINSPLGLQCEFLEADVNSHSNVLDLIGKMPNLRSITFRCEDDKQHIWGSSSTDDELIWLRNHLPTRCSISRDPKRMWYIQIWIDV